VRLGSPPWLAPQNKTPQLFPLRSDLCQLLYSPLLYPAHQNFNSRPPFCCTFCLVKRDWLDICSKQLFSQGSIAGLSDRSCGQSDLTANALSPQHPVNPSFNCKYIRRKNQGCTTLVTEVYSTYKELIRSTKSSSDPAYHYMRWKRQNASKLYYCTLVLPSYFASRRDTNHLHYQYSLIPTSHLGLESVSLYS
jgi:hypothetical protein